MKILSCIATKLLGAGDIIGKVLAVLSLPATVIAAIIYLDEISDYFSTPSLDTKIERVTLRCNYVWRNSTDYVLYQSGDSSKLRELCDRSDIAVSFEFSVTNNDSIARELRSFTVSATVPGYSDLKLDEIRSVEHLIQHGVETTLQRDWRVQTIASDSTAVFEIIAIPSIRPDERNWGQLAERLNERDPTLLDQKTTIAFDASVSGAFSSEQLLAGCAWAFDEEEFDDWHKEHIDTRIQITNTCE